MSRGIDKAMADIFISYAREDRRLQRRSPKRSRTKAGRCGGTRIPTGRRFDNVIAEELALARCVIVLWSSHGILSS